MRATCPALLVWLCGTLLFCAAEDRPESHGGDVASRQPGQLATTIDQLRTLGSQESLRGCPFRLSGTVTLVDANRRLFVLQDDTGAMAVDLNAVTIPLEPGRRVSLEGVDGVPYFTPLPDFPCRPYRRDIEERFEAPSNWGDYYLTRMRGFLHPPATGDYSFWIASDNSSELWLSLDEDPGRVRKIAFLKSGTWVDPYEWSRYPSQHSETLFLRAGQAYYIEAFQEQLTLGDHLAVAWQGPGVSQSVIDARYLTPWVVQPSRSSPARDPNHRTNGILREYWTNYSVGALMALTGPRPFESALTASELKVTVAGPAPWPAPRRIVLDRPLPPEDNYRWVEAEGTVSFVGIDGETATLELTDGRGHAQVHVRAQNLNWPRHPQNWRARVQGVCEGVPSATGPLAPGLIWTPTPSNVAFIEAPRPEGTPLATFPPHDLATSNVNPVLGGFYVTRGVVTFNDRVLNRDCLFIQDKTAGIFISQAAPVLRAQLQLGRQVDIGGNLLPGKHAPGLELVVLNVLGLASMPQPVIPSADSPAGANGDGQWTELAGVVRAVNPNGTLTLMERRGPITIWIGRTPADVLGRYVDATLRARGVMSLRLQDTPLLLIPSRRFVDVMEEAPEDPFAVQPRSVASFSAAASDVPEVHRVKLTGVVTFSHEGLLFVQDASGGARALTVDNPSLTVGDGVEVVGFPQASGYSLTLTEALVRRTGAREALTPRKVDLSEVVAGGLNGSLVQLKATLLAQKSRGTNRILELQAGQRAFEAVLAAGPAALPSFPPGSLLEITGVSEAELVAPLGAGRSGWENPSVTAVQIALRSPADVVLLKGRPWWTWREAAALIGVLSAVVIGSLLVIHLLRRRIGRQQAAQLAFSRQILQNQESERRRIAANLHDSLGQNLLVIKNQARLAMQPVTDESVLRQRLNEISGLASQAIEEVRQITHDLRPYQLDRLGLTQAIRAVIKRVSENSPIQFASHVDDIDRLFDNESEIHLYRIVQESINNVVKHSGATEATVVIKRQPVLLSLSIRDNGKGFDANLINAADSRDAGFGLSGIKERARILSGTLLVDSRPGHGTNLSVDIPLPGSPHET
jgi:signal transduction histidine kinase